MSTDVISKDNVLKGAVVLLAILLTHGTAYSSGSEVQGTSPASVDLSSMPLDNAKEQAEFLYQGINFSPSVEQIMSMVDRQTLESVFPDGLTSYLEQDFTDRVEERIGVDLSSYTPITVVQDGTETLVGYVKKGDIGRSFFD